VDLEDDQPFTCDLPRGHNAFVAVSAGEIEVGPPHAVSRVDAGVLALLGPGRRLRVRAPEQRSQLVVAAGRPIGEPIVQRGPFVMNTEEEIRQAFDDYRRGVLDRG